MFENMFSGFDPKRLTGATTGDQWGTTVQYGSNPLTYSAFNGNVAGIDPGAFGKTAGGVMENVGAGMGSSPASAPTAPSGAFSTEGMDKERMAAMQALAAQNAAGQQRLAGLGQSSAMDQIRKAYG